MIETNNSLHFDRDDDLTESAVPHPSERRREERKEMNLPGMCEIHDPPMRMPCTVVDLSGSGAQLAFDSTDRLPASFRVYVDVLNVILECRTVWKTPTRVGVEQMTRSAGYV